MQHFLKGRRFESFEEVEEACQEFFDLKEPVGTSGRSEIWQIDGKK